MSGSAGTTATDSPRWTRAREIPDGDPARHQRGPGAGEECWRERWNHPEGELGETLVADTEVIVLLEGRAPIRRRGDGQVQHCNAVPGTIWICPAGVYEDNIHLYGEVRESIHLFLPKLPFSATALREIERRSRQGSP